MINVLRGATNKKDLNSEEFKNKFGSLIES